MTVFIYETKTPVRNPKNVSKQTTNFLIQPVSWNKEHYGSLQ